MFAASVMSAYLRNSTIAFRSASGGSNSSSAASTTVTKPSGTVQGDVMVALVYFNATPGSITTPSGWSVATERMQLTSGIGGEWSCNVSMYYKIAGASEPADYTWSSTSSVRVNSAIVSFTGVSSVGTINASANNYSWTGGILTNVTSSAIVTTVPNTMLVLGTMLDQASSSSYTSASGMTTAINTSGGNGPIGIFYSTQVASGSTGGKDTTIGTAEGSASAGAFFIALTPG